MAESEKFHRSLCGWVISSRGYRVRPDRIHVEYVDETGRLYVACEALLVPGNAMVLYAASVPDSEGWSRQVVIDRIVRALLHAKWDVDVVAADGSADPDGSIHEALVLARARVAARASWWGSALFRKMQPGRSESSRFRDHRPRAH